MLVFSSGPGKMTQLPLPVKRYFFVWLETSATPDFWAAADPVRMIMDKVESGKPHFRPSYSLRSENKTVVIPHQMAIFETKSHKLLAAGRTRIRGLRELVKNGSSPWIARGHH